MVVSSDPAWLQGDFTALLGIFDRVGLMKNVGKTVSMVRHPCHAGAGKRTEEAYDRSITGEWRLYAQRQRERIECVECGEFLAVGSMLSHLMTRHGKATGRRRMWTPQTEGGAKTYRMYFPTKGGGGNVQWRGAQGR